MLCRTLVILFICFKMNPVVCHVKNLGVKVGPKLLIAGGKPAQAEEYPFNVQFINRGGMCAATIIGIKTVLTAGHCFDLSKNIRDMMVLAASQYIFDHHRQQHEVWDFRVHPNYNKAAIFSDDIAVVFINSSFLFDQHVQPAKLTDTMEWMRENETLIATGWGQTSEDGEMSLKGLMETKLRFISRKECLNAYKWVTFSIDMFCLYGDGKTDTCKGDSGGGILWNNTVVGIVSHGKGCVKYPGIYTNVYYYTDWIRNATDELLQSYCHFMEK